MVIADKVGVDYIGEEDSLSFWIQLVHFNKLDKILFQIIGSLLLFSIQFWMHEYAVKLNHFTCNKETNEYRLLDNAKIKVSSFHIRLYSSTVLKH